MPPPCSFEGHRIMDYLPETNLARFADRAGFRYDLLAREDGDGHWIENAPAGFDGCIEAIRITAYGRFGNVFYQTLHAIALARVLGCHTVFASPLTVGPPEPVLQLDGLRIVFRIEPGMERVKVPTLAGHFFNAAPFGTALQGLQPAAAWDIINNDLKPMFRDILRTVTPVGRHTLVMSFRAGDIFHGDVAHPAYVQPPASYYLLALAFARGRLGVTDVALVYEDAGNPAIAAVRAHLESQAIPYAVRSADLVADLAYLAGATHLVAPYSTFAEVAAMLSSDIETYVGFRNFESHQHMHLRQTPLLLGVLRLKGVRPILIDDAAGGFIPPLSWDGSPGQLRLIADYPMDNLRLLQDDEAQERETATAAAQSRRQVLACQQEVTRLRDLLHASHDAAQRQQHALRQQVEAAQAMLDAARRDAARIRGDMLQMQGRVEALDRAFRTSTSWRFTAPLRALSRVARSIRPRTPRRGNPSP
jgi:hypothetical protein